MEIERIAADVMALYRETAEATDRLARKGGLSCRPACARCCIHQELDAAVAEYLPLALSWWKRGTAMEELEKLHGMKDRNRCFLLENGAHNDEGRCREYEYRGLTCRLFGFAAVLDKEGTPKLSTCRVIRETHPQECRNLEQAINEGFPAPVMKNFFFRLYAVDAQSSVQLPMNDAIQRALERVITYYSYKN